MDSQTQNYNSKAGQDLKNMMFEVFDQQGNKIGSACLMPTEQKVNTMSVEESNHKVEVYTRKSENRAFQDFIFFKSQDKLYRLKYGSPLFNDYNEWRFGSSDEINLFDEYDLNKDPDPEFEATLKQEYNKTEFNTQSNLTLSNKLLLSVDIFENTAYVDRIILCQFTTGWMTKGESQEEWKGLQHPSITKPQKEFIEILISIIEDCKI